MSDRVAHPAAPDDPPLWIDTMAASGGLSFVAVPLPQIQGYEVLEEVGRSVCPSPGEGAALAAARMGYVLARGLMEIVTLPPSLG